MFINQGSLDDRGKKGLNDNWLLLDDSPRKSGHGSWVVTRQHFMPSRNVFVVLQLV
jgi:hypothetical protein